MDSDDIKLAISLYVANCMVGSALDLLRQGNNGNPEVNLLNYFFKGEFSKLMKICLNF